MLTRLLRHGPSHGERPFVFFGYADAFLVLDGVPSVWASADSDL
ncbi:hypothetical protein [Glutamicibacter ardleyensis]